jgi:hypothetical protein
VFSNKIKKRANVRVNARTFGNATTSTPRNKANHCSLTTHEGPACVTLACVLASFCVARAEHVIADRVFGQPFLTKTAIHDGKLNTVQVYFVLWITKSASSPVLLVNTILSLYMAED